MSKGLLNWKVYSTTLNISFYLQISLLYFAASQAALGCAVHLPSGEFFQEPVTATGASTGSAERKLLHLSGFQRWKFDTHSNNYEKVAIPQNIFSVLEASLVLSECYLEVSPEDSPSKKSEKTCSNHLLYFIIFRISLDYNIQFCVTRLFHTFSRCVGTPTRPTATSTKRHLGYSPPGMGQGARLSADMSGNCCRFQTFLNIFVCNALVKWLLHSRISQRNKLCRYGCELRIETPGNRARILPCFCSSQSLSNPQDDFNANQIIYIYEKSIHVNFKGSPNYTSMLFATHGLPQRP